MKTRVNAVGWAAVVVLSASCAANLASPPAWQPAPPLNEAREAFGVVVDDFGNIYVLGGDNRTGGCSGGGSMVVTIEKLAFDPGTRTYADQWTVLPTMLPTARANFVAVIKDGFIYLIGGNLYGVPDPPVIAQVDRYDLVTGSWDSVTVPPPNTLRTDYGAVVDRQGRIWIMGGRTLPSGTPPLASTEVFDPVRPEPGWQYGPELNTGRTSCSCVMDAAGRLYAIGGYNPVTGEHISSVERLDSCVDLGCQVGRARWKLDAASREPGPQLSEA